MAFPPPLPITVLAAVLFLIAVRQIGSLRLQIWHIMFGGSCVVLLTGDIAPADALKAIDLNVILFLFGMFVVGQALEESGVLAHLSYQYFKRSRNLDQLLAMVIVGAGIASAVLMNDTLAIIGTPVVLLLARKHGLSAKPLLLALAFGVTIGSVPSPIGNPQNLLIAIGGDVPDPFLTFIRYLGIPTLLNGGAAFLLVRGFHRSEWHDADLRHSQEPIRNHDLAVLANISLKIVLFLIGAKTLLALLGMGDALHLTHIALAGALPIIAGSRERFGLMRRIDWQTLLFFASMFVLMDAVWRTGVPQALLAGSGADLGSPAVVLATALVGSQVLSNVPLVALLLPLVRMAGGGLGSMMALAAGSTLAGNMFILGAASNVIIIQQAERRAKETLTFWEFARVGIPLTLLNGVVAWLFL